MKILMILTGGLMKDGITLANIAYMENMNRSDIKIDFLKNNIGNDEVIRRLRELNCEVIEVPNRNKNTIKYFFKLITVIKSNKYDIVHVHGSSALMVIEMIAAKIAGVPIRIAHSRNTTCDNITVDKFLRKLFYRLTTDYFACGVEAGKWLFGEQDFKVIPNAKDFSKFEFSKEKRSEIREKMNLGNNFAICHVGRFNTQKNHEFLIDIFYELKKIKNNSILILIGDGYLRKSIEEKVENLGLKQDVIFMGGISNVHDILHAMDYMILPSKYEGLPNVVIEAQISGLPCLISSNITKECKITDLVEFESLESSSKIWAIKIKDFDINDRDKYKFEILDKIRSEGYDIVESAKRLKNIYINLYNKI